MPSARTTILRVVLEVAVRRERHPVFVERNALRAAWSWSVSSAWPIVVSCRRRSRMRCLAAYARSIESLLLCDRVRHVACPRGGFRDVASHRPEIPCASAFRRKSRSSRTASASRPASCANSSRTATRSMVEHDAGAGHRHGRRRVPRRRAPSIAATRPRSSRGADMIVKVKEPQADERAMLREGQILFTYLHLAPDPEQATELVASGAVCIAYETVTSPRGGLPLLAPMSRSRGPDGRAGRRVLPREAARRPGHAAGRRAGRRLRRRS